MRSTRPTLPGRFADTLVLTHVDRVAVLVTDFAAFPTGFSFAVQTIPRCHGPREWADLHRFGRRHGVDPGGSLPDEHLRFGVEFADGPRATSIDILSCSRNLDETPTPPGGGGGGGLWNHDTWVWPLPPPGPLNFVCEWPALDIPLTRAELDATRLLEAAAQSRLSVGGPRRLTRALEPA